MPRKQLGQSWRIDASTSCAQYLICPGRSAPCARTTRRPEPDPAWRSTIVTSPREPPFLSRLRASKTHLATGHTLPSGAGCTAANSQGHGRLASELKTWWMVSKTWQIALDLIGVEDIVRFRALSSGHRPPFHLIIAQRTAHHHNRLAVASEESRAPSAQLTPSLLSFLSGGASGPHTAKFTETRCRYLLPLISNTRRPPHPRAFPNTSRSETSSPRNPQPRA